MTIVFEGLLTGKGRSKQNKRRVFQVAHYLG